MPVTNKAVAELQSLANMESQGKADIANASKLMEARNDPAAVNTGEAEFALPEALITGIGAATILGPAGLLLGMAQGILGKKEQQNAIDAYAEATGAFDKSRDVILSEFDRFAMTANPEDMEQISGLQSQVDAAAQMMRSPALMDQGQALLADAYDKYNTMLAKNEEQLIAQQTAEAQRQRDLSQYQQGVQQTLLDDYDRQSANYETIVQGSANAKEMIARGNPVDIVSALIQVNKALDPTSVVRPEEAKALGNVGTLLERAVTQLDEWAGSGLPLSMEQRKDLMTLVEGIETQARGFQMKRDIRFQERAIDAELPMKYVDDFRRVTDLPAFKPAGFQDREGPAQQKMDSIIKALDETASDQAIINAVGELLGANRTQEEIREGMNAALESRPKR